MWTASVAGEGVQAEGAQSEGSGLGVTLRPEHPEQRASANSVVGVVPESRPQSGCGRAHGGQGACAAGRGLSQPRDGCGPVHCTVRVPNKGPPRWVSPGADVVTIQGRDSRPSTQDRWHHRCYADSPREPEPERGEPLTGTPTSPVVEGHCFANTMM